MTKQLPITQKHIDKARELMQNGGFICQHCPTAIAFCDLKGFSIGTIWVNRELIHSFRNEGFVNAHGLETDCIKYGVPEPRLATQIDNFSNPDRPFQPGVYDYEDVSTPE